MKKGPNLCGIDPLTGKMVALFDPRKDDWGAHFEVAIGGLMRDGIAISGLTELGRATAQVLGLNDEMRQLVRYELWTEGLHPGCEFIGPLLPPSFGPSMSRRVGHLGRGGLAWIAIRLKRRERGESAK